MRDFLLLFDCVWSLTCGAFWAEAHVGVLSVLAGATVLAGLAQTLVNVSFTQASSEARVAVASKRCQSILTSAIVAGVRVAFVDVDVTVLPCVTWTQKLHFSHDNLFTRTFKNSDQTFWNWKIVSLPSAHSQVYLLGPSVHLAPFLQGVLAHSSMSTWHRFPEKPASSIDKYRITLRWVKDFTVFVDMCYILWYSREKRITEDFVKVLRVIQILLMTTQ